MLDEFVKYSINKNQQEAKALMIKQRQEKVSELLIQSGLGKRFQNKTFDNFVSAGQLRNALEQATAFAAGFPAVKGLLLTGPVGVGKTHLAAAIVNELTKRMYVVVFGNSISIISRIKQTYGKTGESELDIINALTSVDLLVIDDLGKEKASDNTSAILYQIINRLYEEERPVVITTNYTSDMLANQLGERGQAIVSRLTEMCVPVIMQGIDWRINHEEG
ncbi:ATP-binding protein [Mahella australiensis]|nr:ATP-binding protein [Mahella australiensis]